jgi:hypothetical protein
MSKKIFEIIMLHKKYIAVAKKFLRESLCASCAAGIFRQRQSRIDHELAGGLQN